MPFQFTQGGLCVPPFVDGVRQYKPRKRAAGVTAVGGEFRRGGQPLAWLASWAKPVGRAHGSFPNGAHTEPHGVHGGPRNQYRTIGPPEAGTGPGEVDGL